MNTKTIIFIIVFAQNYFSSDLMAFFLSEKKPQEQESDLIKHQNLLAMIAHLSCKKFCEGQSKTDEQDTPCRNFCLAQHKLVIKGLLRQNLAELLKDFKETHDTSSVEKLYSPTSIDKNK